jgi:hypothetical protein
MLFTISLCDFPCMADLSVPSFPVQAQFTDELLELLRNVFRGMIDNAVERLNDVPCISFSERGQFLSRVVEVIDKTRHVHHLS